MSRRKNRYALRDGVEGLSIPLDLGQDDLPGLVPDVALGVEVVLFEIAVDRGDQFRDWAKLPWHPSRLVQAGPGCNIGPVMCLDGGGSGASSGGFGLENVVSTFSFRFVDVLVSRVPIWNHDPDRVFGEPDFFDLFRYEYVLRRGGITVSSRVAAAGVPNITRRPIGLPSFDHGLPDRFDIQIWRDKLISMIGKWIRDKLKRKGELQCMEFRKKTTWLD